MPIVDSRVRLPMDLRPESEHSRPAGYTAQYEAVFPGLNEAHHLTVKDLIAEMEANGVESAWVHNEYESSEYGDPSDAMNQALGKLVKEHPGRFEGFGALTMYPLEPMRAYRQVSEIADLGLMGVTMEPGFHGWATDDRRLYPAYARASELGLAVALHVSVNYTLHRPMINSHPLQLDQVACDFPDLVLIACHGGWPWTAELVAVARKHPNVYIEFGGIAPKYVGLDGTGWEVMFRFMNSLLAERVLHGTDWPTMSMERAIGEWREAGLKPAVLDALFSGNAARLRAELRQRRR